MPEYDRSDMLHAPSSRFRKKEHVFDMYVCWIGPFRMPENLQNYCAIIILAIVVAKRSWEQHVASTAVQIKQEKQHVLTFCVFLIGSIWMPTWFETAVRAIYCRFPTAVRLVGSWRLWACCAAVPSCHRLVLDFC